MPLPDYLEAIKPRLGNLIDGLTSEEDLILIGPANIAQLLLKGFWKQPHRTGGPFDRAFHTLLKFLPKHCRQKFYELWEGGCDPGDEFDFDFQHLVQAFLPQVPWLPRLQRPTKLVQGETVILVQSAAVIASLNGAYEMHVDTIRRFEPLKSDAPIGVTGRNVHGIFNCEPYENSIIALNHAEGSLPHSVMMGWEYHYFRDQSDDRLLRICFLNGGGKPTAWEEYRALVRDSRLKPYKPFTG